MLNNTANNASGKFNATGATAGSGTGTGTGTLNIVDEMARKVRDFTQFCSSGFDSLRCLTRAFGCYQVAAMAPKMPLSQATSFFTIAHTPLVQMYIDMCVNLPPRLSIDTALHPPQRHFHSHLLTAHTGYWCGRNKSDETLAKGQGRNFLAVDVRLSHMPDRPLFRYRTNLVHAACILSVSLCLCVL